MGNQEKIWNSIASDWKSFRKEPIEEVKEFLEGKEGKILDLGCGSGRNFIKINGTIYGVDFSENMLKFAKTNSEKERIKTELIKAETNNLPFKDNFFDTAIFVAVLHCIPKREKREKSLKELIRVMKPETEAYISVWDKNQDRFKNSPKETIVIWKQDGKEYKREHYLYDKEEFVSLLKKTGFEIVKVSDKQTSKGFYSQKNINVIVRKP